jgi:hypothetical protein
MAKADMYMLLAEGAKLTGQAFQETGDVSTHALAAYQRLEEAFSQHQFVSKGSNIPNPYIITHELRISLLEYYRASGVARLTDHIFSTMYNTEEATPMYRTKYNLDRTYFTDFDTKLQNGTIRRIGEWTYGEKIGDGVLKLVGFFYDPSVLKMEKK